MDCKVEYYRMNGYVIIVKLDGKETKREIMTNKHNLKGEAVCIYCMYIYMYVYFIYTYIHIDVIYTYRK